MAVFLVVMAQVRWSSQIHGAALLLLIAGAVAVALSPASADAHDPGQGRPIAPVTLTGTSGGRGGITITADSGGSTNGKDGVAEELALIRLMVST